MKNRIQLVLLTIITVFVMTSHAQDVNENVRISAIAWSPDGQHIVLANTAGTLRIIAIQTSTERVIEQAHNGPIYALAWSPDGLSFASGSSSTDTSLRIWDVATGEQKAMYDDYGLDTLAVGWSPDGSTVIAITAEPFSRQTSSIIVNVVSGEVTYTSFGASGDIKWSPDGSKIALSRLADISIYSATTFELLTQFPVPVGTLKPGLQFQPVTVTWHPNNTLVATGTGDGRIFVWNTTSQQVYDLAGNDYQGTERFSGWINSLRFEEAGSRLMSVSGDGTIRYWDINQRTLLAEEKVSVNYVSAFSPTGAQVALGLNPEMLSEADRLQSEVSNTFPSIQIIVPVATIERFAEIAASCNAPASLVDSILQTDAAQTLLTGLDALPEDAIPAGCAADLRAIAEAMMAK